MYARERITFQNSDNIFHLIGNVITKVIKTAFYENATYASRIQTAAELFILVVCQRKTFGRNLPTGRDSARHPETGI